MKRWLLTIVILTSCCDLGATLYFSKTHKGFVEANPIVKYIWDNSGDIGFVVFKLIMTFIVCVCISSILKHEGRLSKITMPITVLVLCVALMGWWIFWIFWNTGVS